MAVNVLAVSPEPTEAEKLAELGEEIFAIIYK